jgi:DNA-binding Lrp family transcriptional regulator
MPWIGPTEAAKRLGISPQALRKKLQVLADEGVARRIDGRWKLRQEGLEVAYDDVTRSRSDSPRRLSSAVKPAVDQPPLPLDREQLKDEMRAMEIDRSMPKSEADRLHSIYRARLMEIDVMERERQLVEVKTVEERLFESDRRIRNQAQNWSARIAPDLASETNEVKVAVLLDVEVNKLLSELANPEDLCG